MMNNFITSWYYKTFSLKYQIKQIIDKYDFIELFKNECPDDEYICEVEEIYNIILDCKAWDSYSIQLILFDVFEDYFGTSLVKKEHCVQYAKAAKEISTRIKWYHKLMVL